MNRLHSPAYRSRYTRYSEKQPVSARIGGDSALTLYVLGTARAILHRGGNDEHVFVVDRIRIKGSCTSPTGNETLTIQIYDTQATSGGNLLGFMPFQIPNGQIIDVGGTASAGGADTITDAGNEWGTNSLTGMIITLTGGTGSGQNRRIASNTATEITVDTAWTTQPSTDTTFTVYAPSQHVDFTVNFGGRFCLPPSAGLRSQNSTGTYCVPEVYGYYMPVQEAASLGIWPGLENWFCKGVIPSGTSATVLQAAVAGQSIELHGYCFTGSPMASASVAGPGTFTVTHYDGTTDRGTLKFYRSGGNKGWNPSCATNLERNHPLGASIRYTASANMVSRCAFFCWGRYTKDPNTYNIHGLQGIYGTATGDGGGADTIADTTKEWQTNIFAGFEIEVVAGAGVGQVRTVESNTATVITNTTDWTTAVDDTSVYRIRVSDGEKFWAFLDAGTNTTGTDSGYYMLTPEKETFAVVTHFQASVDQATGASDSGPTGLDLIAGNYLHKGLAVANVAGVAFTGIRAVSSSAATSLVAPLLAFPVGGDAQSVEDNLDIPAYIYPGNSSYQMLGVDVAGGMTGASCSIDGRFRSPTAHATNNTGILRRIQGEY